MPSNKIDYDNASETEARDRASQSTPLPSGPAEKHALIIEDMPVIAMSIQDELADMGYSVAIAWTEAQAVALADERCPDLIIADARLEEGSGIVAVRQICRDRAIAVIFMTGDFEAVEGAIGEAALLSKPFGSAELKSSICTAGPISTGQR